MKYFIIIASFLFTSISIGQELMCQVSVLTNPALTVTTTEKEIFQELEKAVTEVMNETSWTNEHFEVEERINCNIQISITNVNGPESFEATFQIQATRPVYNTTYNTTLLNFLDEDVNFTFRRGSKIVFSKNQYSSNLASILGFYAYYILGLDGDSFAKNGGEPYLKEAQNIVMLAQSSRGDGWKSNQRGKKNRFWLIDNALHELFSPLRETFYDYHRKGLDRMYDSPAEARKEIKASLEKLISVNQARPNSINVVNFIRSKRDELTNIFRDADNKEKTELVNTLKRLDPTNASIYQELLQ
ncbi:MAG: DUF4835 family protein [Brumimicrobium sp.]